MRHPILIAAGTLLALAFIAPAQATLKPIKRVEPAFPPEAARARQSGFVEVEYTVDASGKVVSVSVLTSRPARVFESAAVKAVKQWQFAPGEDGRGRARIDFAL